MKKLILLFLMLFIFSFSADAVLTSFLDEFTAVNTSLWVNNFTSVTYNSAFSTGKTGILMSTSGQLPLYLFHTMPGNVTLTTGSDYYLETSYIDTTNDAFSWHPGLSFGINPGRNGSAFTVKPKIFTIDGNGMFNFTNGTTTWKMGSICSGGTTCPVYIFGLRLTASTCNITPYVNYTASGVTYYDNISSKDCSIWNNNTIDIGYSYGLDTVYPDALGSARFDYVNLSGTLTAAPTTTTSSVTLTKNATLFSQSPQIFGNCTGTSTNATANISFAYQWYINQTLVSYGTIYNQTVQGVHRNINNLTYNASVAEKIQYKLNSDASDSSGNGYTAGATDITYSLGKINNAATFNGASSYLQPSYLTYKNNYATGYSIAFWYKTTTTAATTDWIYQEGSTSATYPFVGLKRVGTNIYFDVYGNSGSLGIDQFIAATVTAGTWYHIVLTDNNGDAKIYINGALDVTSLTYTPQTVSNIGAAAIGVKTNGFNQNMNGQIDDFRTYTRVLSTEEINTLYSNGGGRELGLSGFSTSGNYTFGCQAQDSIGGGNGAWVNSSMLIFTYSNTTYSGATTNETAIYPNSTQPINLSITFSGGDVIRNCSFWNNDTATWVRNTTVFPTFGGTGTVTAAWIPKFLVPYPNLVSTNYWNVSCYDEWGNLTNSTLQSYTVKNLTAPTANYSAIKINTSVMSGYPNLQGNCTANSTNSTANLSYSYWWFINQTSYSSGVSVVNATQGVSFNINNLTAPSSGNYIFSCRASDVLTGLTSSWRNSSAQIITYSNTTLTSITTNETNIYPLANQAINLSFNVNGGDGLNNCSFWNNDTGTWAKNYTISYSGLATYLRTYSVAAKELYPDGFYFRSDGLKMYVVGQNADTVFEYNLATPWDTSSSTYLRSFSIGAQDSDPVGVSFKPDGLKMYIIGSGGDNVYEYNLAVAWDVTSATYFQQFSIAAQEIWPTGFYFRPDGLKMYTAGANGVSIDEYNLGTAWNIATASYLREFSVAAQESNPHSVFFKSDGTKMYMTGIGGAASIVYEYNLVLSWDVTSAVYLQNLNIAANVDRPYDVSFKSDGLKMYILDGNGDGGRADVVEYTSPSGWTLNSSGSISSAFVQTTWIPKFVVPYPNIISTNYWKVNCSDEWGNVTVSAQQSYTVKNLTAPYTANISTSVNTTSIYTGPRIYGICGANSTNSTAVIQYNYRLYKDTVLKEDGTTLTYIQGGNQTIVYWDGSTSPGIDGIGNYTFSCRATDTITGLQGNWINASDVQIKDVNGITQNTNSLLQSLRSSALYYWSMDQKDYISASTTSGTVKDLLNRGNVTYGNTSGQLESPSILGQSMNISTGAASASLSNAADPKVLALANETKTYSFWIRPDIHYNVQEDIVAWGATATGASPWFRMYVAGTTACTTRNRLAVYYSTVTAREGATLACSTTALPNNTWTHVVVVMNLSNSNVGENKTRIWINGNFETVTTVSNPPTVYAAPLNAVAIGYVDDFGADYNGYIDEFAIFSGILNDSQIKAIYNAGLGNQYPFLMPYTNSSISIANTTNVLAYPKIEGYCNGYNILNTTSQMVYNYTWYYNTTIVKSGQNATFASQGVNTIVDTYYPASPGNYTFECFAQDVNSLVWGNKANATVLMFDDPGIAPTITLGAGTDILSNNKTVFSVGGMPNRIAFNLTYHDINLFQANVSVVCDINGTLYSFEQLDINTTDYNITFTVPLNISLPLQKCYLRSYSSDDHTESNIADYDYTETADGVEFATTENNRIIISDVINPLDSIGITKARDRYSMNFAYSAPSPDRTITLQSNNPIYYRENSYYPAHFVVWNPELHEGNWVDFKDKDLSPGDYTVTCASENECQVLINYNKQDFSFESIGGTNVRETSYEFYIGGQINVSSRNLYNNQTIKNITLNYTCISDTCAAQSGTFYKTFNDSTTIYNVSNGTWQLYFSDAGINHYLINGYQVIVNTSYGQIQNWTTSQAQLIVHAIDIKTGSYIDSLNISLKGNGIVNTFNNDSTEAIFYLNATTYEVNVTSPGYYNTTKSISLAFMQNYTYNVPMPFLATLNFIDEKNLTPFNISSADRIDFSIFCADDTVNTTVITSTTQTFPVMCNYTYFLVSVYYTEGSSSVNYVRSLIQDLSASSTFNVYLINLLTTAAVQTDLIADDMLTQYQNIRIYVTKSIGNSTQQIYAGFTDIENKISTYLVQGQIYNIAIYSDNQPIFAAGDYQATNAGQRRIKLYTFSNVFTGDYYSKDVSSYIGMYNDTAINGTVYAYALFNDTKNVTDNVTFRIYYANNTVIYYSSLVPDNGGALFMFNMTPYLNYTVNSQLIIDRQDQQVNLSKTLNVYEKIIMPINKYMLANRDLTQWLLLLLISVLAIYGTMQNSVIVSAIIALIVTVISTPWFGWLDIPLWLVGIIDLVVFAMLIKTRGNKKLE